MRGKGIPGMDRTAHEVALASPGNYESWGMGRVWREVLEVVVGGKPGGPRAAHSRAWLQPGREGTRTGEWTLAGGAEQEATWWRGC